MLATLLAAPVALAQPPAASGPARAMPVEIVLVEAEMVTPAAVAQWKKEQFQAVAVVLDERTGKAAYQDLGRRISDGGLDLYCWIRCNV